MPNGPQWDRLAAAVRTFRASRGMSQAAIAKRGGPSDTTLSKIERGEWRPTRASDETLAKLDAGMGWGHGRASRILAGDDSHQPSVPPEWVTTDLSEVSVDALLIELRRRIMESQRRAERTRQRADIEPTLGELWNDSEPGAARG